MKLGYCVVFDHHEQGWRGLTAVVCHQDLDKAVQLVETLSGYSSKHERYNQEVFDLTQLYHQNALGLVEEKELTRLSSYSPEAFESIQRCLPVDYVVQVYQPLSTRCWINRKWDFVTEQLYSHLKNVAKAKNPRRNQEGS